MKLTSRFKPSPVLVVLAGLAFAPCAAGTVLAPAAKHQLSTPRTSAQALHDRMRVVFEDQILWTRMMATVVLRDLKGNEAYKDRLLTNHESFERILAPHYKDGAEKLGALLEEHIQITEKVFVQLGAGDTLGTVLPYWYANADDIAIVMSTLNPDHWPATESQLFWRTYLDTTLRGAFAQLKGDGRSDVAEQDALHLHALKLADFMSDGILRQFPLPN